MTFSKANVSSSLSPTARWPRRIFEQLAQTIDPMLEDMDRLNGLMIDAPEFPGWKDFAGLISHIKFVKKPPPANQACRGGF